MLSVLMNVRYVGRRFLLPVVSVVHNIGENIMGILERLKDPRGKKKRKRTEEVFDKIFGVVTIDLSFMSKMGFRELVRDVKKVKNVTVDWELKKITF